MQLDFKVLATCTGARFFLIPFSFWHPDIATPLQVLSTKELLLFAFSDPSLCIIYIAEVTFVSHFFHSHSESDIMCIVDLHIMH